MRIATGALLLVLGACGGTNDGGVDVTLHIDATIDDAQLAQIDQLVVHASGDESGTYPIAVTGLERTERLVYRQGAGTHVLVLAVDALAQGAEVGSGTSSTLAVGGGQATAAIIVYGAATQDLGAPDLTSTPGDGSEPEGDLATPPQSPVFVAISNNSAAQGDVDPPVQLPPNTQPGDFLFATVYTFDQSTTITAPSGWTQYQTIPGSATSFRVSWFYRVADGTEPSELTFPRSPTNVVFIALASYRGALASAPIDPGSGSAQIISGNPYVLSSIDLAHDHTLLVGTWISDSGNTPTWTPPIGTTARRTDTILVADQPFAAAGATGDLSATCTATLTNGTAGLLIGLRSE